MGARHELLAVAHARIRQQRPPSNPVALAGNPKVAEIRETLTHLGWGVYEWWIRLSNDTANEFYASPFAIDLTSPIFETAVRLEQMRDAFSATFFGNLWAAFGLPTADGVLTLREQVRGLRDERRFSTRAIGGERSNAELADEHSPRPIPKGSQEHRATIDHPVNAARAAK
jgi:hypothetical protein